MRLDKWLWAARFYKTRGVAAESIGGGKVKVNGVAAKPARELKIGDTIRLRAGDQEWTVIVQGFNEQRRPATEARRLYEETEESARRRAEAAELRALAPSADNAHKGRPTKRDRRQLSRLQGD